MQSFYLSFTTIIIAICLIFFCLITEDNYEKNMKYSPDICTPIEYKFTFIFDKKENRFKCHGIWSDKCLECPTCSYPTCCNNNKLIYTDPYDPTNFIQRNWFNSTSHEDCSDNRKVSLFEHEYFKHISCTNITNTTDFLNLAIYLYDLYYYEYVNDHCNGYNEIWLDLDENFNYVLTECV